MLASSPEFKEWASKIHSAIKALIWIYEWRRNNGRVNIKLESRENSEVSWDVKVEGRTQIVYEVETLYGVGNVLAKLTKKMREIKTCGKHGVFVFRNIDILRHLQLLVSFRELWRKEGCSLDIMGVDLERGELVDLDEFVKLMKEVSRA